jgi:DNA-binding GntR family transcriptional regulator
MTSAKESGRMAGPHGRANFETLYAAVSDLLAGGRYRPGDRIGLKALSEALGVSVTPLREALSRLVGRDVVTERRTEGYYLTRLDARDIADLYGLHKICVERALQALPPGSVDARASDGDIWQHFDALVMASGDRILAGVRRYLDDRLALIRRCERELLGDEADAQRRLQSSIATSDLDAARAAVDRFHETRIDRATDIADAINRRRQD